MLETSELIYGIVNGLRPVTTIDTPECFANLMKRCWDSDPARRPSAKDICDVCYDYNKILSNLIELRNTIYNSIPSNLFISMSTNFRMNQGMYYIKCSTSKLLLDIKYTDFGCKFSRKP